MFQIRVYRCKSVAEQYDSSASRLLSSIYELDAVALILEGARVSECLPAVILALVLVCWRTNKGRELEHCAETVCSATVGRPEQVDAALHKAAIRIGAVNDAEVVDGR